jgi:glyoxylase-like metal-dependent hydrolase (beta-lactamase superfamily II)
VKLAFGERALPPALRAPLSSSSERWMNELECAPYDQLFELPESRLLALPCGKLAVLDGGVPTGLSVPVVGYLLKTDGSTMVVDCGLGPRWRQPAGGARLDEEGPAPKSSYRPSLDGPTFAERLGGLGIRPDRLVCTHLHHDHCGDAAELGLAVEAAAPEWQRLDAPGAEAAGYPARDLEGVERRVIVLDPAHPIGPFRASAQLAPGVVALDTSGHSEGSISIFACLGATWALLCGDAAYPRLEEPGSAAYQGALRIRRALQDLEGIQVFAGHDTAVLRASSGGNWLGVPNPFPDEAHHRSPHEH